MAAIPIRRVALNDGKSHGFAWPEVPIAGDGVIGVSLHDKQPLFLVSILEQTMGRSASVVLDAVTAIDLHHQLGEMIKKIGDNREYGPETEL